jgi:hypothetical protein
MKVLYFIGNGFDLNVGLRTRFSDVLGSYMHKFSTDRDIIEFKKDINQNFRDWSEFEQHMGKYTDKFSSSEDAAGAFYVYNKCIFDFQKYLQKYLRTEKNKANFNIPEIVRSFKDSILNFTQYLNEEPKQIFDRILNTKVNYDYVSFNYTDTFDECLKIFKEDKGLPILYTNNDYLGNVFHIHGTLENDMILGVDNINQIANIVFRNLELVNRIIKPKINDLLENQNNKTMNELIKNSDIYIVYGMSIGETDKTWWNAIAKQMIDNKDKRLVIFTYDDNSDFSIPYERIEHIRLWKQYFMNQINASEPEKADISQRISIAINEKMFNTKVV